VIDYGSLNNPEDMDKAQPSSTAVNGDQDINESFSSIESSSQDSESISEEDKGEDFQP
jgi:hypothetical protein